MSVSQIFLVSVSESAVSLRSAFTLSPLLSPILAFSWFSRWKINYRTVGAKPSSSGSVCSTGTLVVYLCSMRAEAVGSYIKRPGSPWNVEFS